MHLSRAMKALQIVTTEIEEQGPFAQFIVKSSTSVEGCEKSILVPSGNPGRKTSSLTTIYIHVRSDQIRSDQLKPKQLESNQIKQTQT